ncbi:mannosyltransferase [Gillisia hiemivivida]|uniref:Mannosyltransferase n=2 Tax=Gillisia hiemivivida TaxID=291190 RepID=A0A5C6ZWP2_9FLAO|nr:mannosyltransferase [Gillisia hiemivivida]
MSLLLIVSSAAFYVAFAYDLERSDLIKLIGLYSGVFYLSWKLYKIEKVNFWFLAGVALLFRLLFIGAIPNLSQDFYRFIWDGRMIAAGFNPYLYLPENLIELGTAPIAQAKELFDGMGALSASHFTNYPPLNQLLFAIAGILSGKSIIGAVVILRMIIILADIGVLYFGRKLLINLKLPESRIFLYLLNPFIIIEVTGNLHFEGVMVFFLVWSLYLLQQKKWIGSAIIFACSVLLKLVPLMFLPVFFGYFIYKRENINDAENESKLGFAKLLGFYLIIGITVVMGFLPILSSVFIENFMTSISLWFQKFEFNASFYYIVRWVGFQSRGYNIIETAGKALPLVTIGILAGLSFFRKNNSFEKLVTAMLFGFTAYLFLSTTVHPWYLAIPLMLSLFTTYKYLMVWSFVVILSYAAYTSDGFQENLWLVALEYIIVIGVFIKELFGRKTLLQL